jgi:hypothetical protein
MPGKRDRSSPRSYHIISLLSNLGKGLERIVARRLAHAAIIRKILPMRYFGALLARSSSDLIQLLANDIKQAFAWRESLPILTFDVKGGFDNILPNRLIHPLIEQEWPTCVLSVANPVHALYATTLYCTPT